MSDRPEPTLRHVVVPRTASVWLAGEPGPAVSELLFLLHGYGQHARDLLEECAALATPERLLVAPEGLSRFYLRGTGGRTGASWMTRAEREHEIADHVRYLDAVHAGLAGELGGAPALHVLGFSQGVATAWRWTALGGAPVARLVAWAGAVPPDVDLDDLRRRRGALGLALVLGSEDRWIDEEGLAGERARLERHGFAHDVLRFEGGHRLDAATLSRLFAPRHGS